jgi:hypothetical protein
MLRRIVSIAFLVPAAFLVACSSGGATTGSNGAGGGGTGGANQGGAATGGSGTGGSWDPGGKVTSYHAKIGGIQVATGGENVQCITFRLDNADAFYARRFATTLTQGTHHMILYKSSATVENKTPTDCPSLGGFLQGDDHPVFIAQQLMSTLELPTDTDANRPVALKMDAHQMVKLELHYFNTTGSALTVSGDIQLDTIPIESSVTEADLAFWGDENIQIPAHGEFDTGTQFQHGIPDTKTFAVTTHQHHLGTEMRIWFGTGTDAANGKPIDDNLSWSNPALVILDPPVKFGPAPMGEVISPDGFAYDCHWVNPTSSPVMFGESVNDEMCFLWHYYYPSHGFQVCFGGICKTMP